METTFVITPHVINTINSLPQEERMAITLVLAVELILGAKASSELTPMQQVLYSMIKNYIERDTTRMQNVINSIAAIVPVRV